MLNYRFQQMKSSVHLFLLLASFSLILVTMAGLVFRVFLLRTMKCLTCSQEVEVQLYMYLDCYHNLLTSIQCFFFWVLQQNWFSFRCWLCVPGNIHIPPLEGYLIWTPPLFWYWWIVIFVRIWRKNSVFQHSGMVSWNLR